MATRREKWVTSPFLLRHYPEKFGELEADEEESYVMIEKTQIPDLP